MTSFIVERYLNLLLNIKSASVKKYVKQKYKVCFIYKEAHYG